MSYKKLIETTKLISEEEKIELWEKFNVKKGEFYKKIFKFNITYKILRKILHKYIQKKYKNLNMVEIGNKQEHLRICGILRKVLRKKNSKLNKKVYKNIIYEEVMRLNNSKKILKSLSDIIIKKINKKNKQYAEIIKLSDEINTIRHAIAYQNMKLILKVINFLSGFAIARTIDKEDMFSSGFQALLVVIDIYQYERNNKFSSIAYWYVLGNVQLMIYQVKNIIKKTRSYISKMIKILQAQEQLRKDDKIITNESVAKLTGIPETVVSKLLMLNTKSVGIDDEMTECYEDKKIQKSEILFEKKENIRILYDRIENLSFRDKQIIEMRYGIHRKEKTLEEIGRIFNVTKERIRQIIKKIIDQLKTKKFKTRIVEEDFYEN